MNRAIAYLNDLVGAKWVRQLEPLKKHTSFEIGGPADVMVWPKDQRQCAELIYYCGQEKLPIFVLGKGSNLLVSDDGMTGVVLCTERLSHFIIHPDGTVYAQAGVGLIELSEACAKQSLAGLEFACGIPGSVGGAVYMNAGAYIGEMKNVVTAVEVLDETGRAHLLSAEDMDFSYRYSCLKDKPLLCTGVHLTLQKDKLHAINARILDFTEQRENKQPLDMPSAGSTFKRPPGKYAGPLIIESGLQGYRLGGAQVSTKHAGFVVNCGNATAQDVLNLIDHVQSEVKNKTGIMLEPEVRMVGRENETN